MSNRYKTLEFYETMRKGLYTGYRKKLRNAKSRKAKQIIKINGK